MMELNRDKISISTCENCTCHRFIYTNIETNGNATWSKYNEKQAKIKDNLIL